MTSPNPLESWTRILPRTPVERWLAPVQRFLHVEAASGVVLLACTVLAIGLANSPYAKDFAALWKLPVALSVGGFTLAGTLGHLVINDGLMTIFFFVVGLEIKREIVAGELSDVRKAMLPVFAALGGMILPAGIYLALQWGRGDVRGWAVPMATDIAFVVGFLALLGPRVPFGLKIFLLSLAIVDDLGAVLVIALVFSDSIAWGWMLAALAGFAVTYLFNRIGVRRVGGYVVVGAFIWLAFLKAGIHPTVAGVLLGLLTPSNAWVGDQAFTEILERLWRTRKGVADSEVWPEASLPRLRFAASETESPLTRLETALHPWVAFGIMPLFALANAGVVLDPAGLRNPVAVAVAVGLVVGKPLGIVLFSLAAVWLGVSSLPRGVSVPMLIGAGCLGGIGFTMALFINTLAFPAVEFPTQEAAGKIGILTGSLVSAVLGVGLLLLITRRTQAVG